MKLSAIGDEIIITKKQKLKIYRKKFDFFEENLDDMIRKILKMVKGEISGFLLSHFSKFSESCHRDFLRKNRFFSNIF